MNNQNIFAMSFPAIEGDNFPANVVTQGHVDYCAASGHATHTVDGVDQGFCPRCGTVTRPATNTHEEKETNTMNLHDYLTGLKADVDAGEGEQRTRSLVRLALSHVDTDGDHGQMWYTARESLGFVLDVAVNQGTAEDMRELRELLDESGSDFSAQPSVDEAIELIGQLYQHNYRPDENVECGLTPLDDILAEWNQEIGRAAMYAVLAYVEENWEEEEEEEEEIS